MESVCSFALHDTNDPTISEESALEDGDFVYYTLPIDRRYSIFFVISNAAGTRTIIPGTNFSEICRLWRLHVLPPSLIVLWFIYRCILL